MQAARPQPVFVAGTQGTAVWSADDRRDEALARSPWALGTRDETRRVYGTVYALEGEFVRPFQGAVVADLLGSRAVTGRDGTFELETESPSARIWLEASAPGFVPALETGTLAQPAGQGAGNWFALASALSRPGVELFLVAAPVERITLRIVSPVPVPHGITLWAGWLGVGTGSNAAYDEDFVFSAQADDRGEVVIDTPLRLLGAQFGAYGPGFLAGSKDWVEPPRSHDGSRVVEISLRPRQTSLISGRVRDLRTGAALAGARVATFDGAVCLTDRHGAYSLWAASTWDSPAGEEAEALQVCAWGYWGMQTRLDLPESVASAAGACERPDSMSSGGSWDFGLRPAVQVRGKVTMRHGAMPAPADLTIDGANVWYAEASQLRLAIDATGTFQTNRFPWGLEFADFTAMVDGKWIRRRVTLPATAWNQSGVVEFNIVIEN